VGDRCIREELGDEASGSVLAVSNVEPDEGDLARKRFRCCLEERGLGATRDTPRRPDVEHLDLTRVVGLRDDLTRIVLQRKAENFLFSACARITGAAKRDHANDERDHNESNECVFLVHII